MAHWRIPPPLLVDWPMRELSTAHVTTQRLDDGRLEVAIEHALLTGITPAMMRWWISMLDQHVEWQGQKVLAYRLWHPRDHVHFEIFGRRPDGAVVAPVRFHLVEAFGAQRRFLVEQWFDVPELDERGFRLQGRIAGLPLELRETFEAVPGGTRMVVRMRLGAAGGLLTKPLTRFAQWLKAEQLEMWKRHNVEEDGTLPHFLPALYARYHP